MHLQILAPAPQLQPYIKCYYVSESNYQRFVTDVFFADGCVEAVFHAGLDFYRGEVKECSAKVIGQIIQPLTMRALGRGKTFGIWFYPHTFSLFCGIPLHEINDRILSLDNLFNTDFIDTVFNYLANNDTAVLAQHINKGLLKKLRYSPMGVKEEVIAYAVTQLQLQRNCNIGQLAQHCGVTQRYLQKIFNLRVGYSPAMFAKVIRFQRALRGLVEQTQCSLTRISGDAGYYDQAHFIRDFRQFTGVTPTQFRLSIHPINQYFINL